MGRWRGEREGVGDRPLALSLVKMYSGPIFGTGAERQERGGGRDSETRSAPPAPRWQETDVDETLVDLHKVDCNSVCPFKVPAPLPAPLPAQLTPGKRPDPTQRRRVA